MAEAPPPVWDIATGRSSERYLLRFDQAAEAWRTVATHARLTVETNPITKERAPAPIGTVQVRPLDPGAGLRVVSTTVAPDRMSVEVVVGAAPATDPTPGPHGFLIRLWPTTSPFDAGATAVAAAGGLGGALGAAITSGTRVPSSEVRFDVTVEEPARFVVVPDGDVLLASDTREPVQFSAKVEVRSKGGWAPRLDHNINAAPWPATPEHPWAVQVVPRAQRAWGGIAGILRATRLMVGDGAPVDCGYLRVHTTLAQSLRIPGDKRLAVRLTTRPVPCRISVVRAATGRVLAEKKDYVATGDILRVSLTSPDQHLRWDGLDLRVEVLHPPAGYAGSHLATVSVPLTAAGTQVVDLRRPERRDRWGRSCDVALELKDDAPGVWRLTLAKRGWADTGVIELGQKIAFDRLQDLGEKGGRLRVFAEGRLETALPQTVGPRFLKAFDGALHVRLPEEPIQGRLVPAASDRDADCLEFDVRPSGSAPGGAPPSGSSVVVDVQVDMRIEAELEAHLARTDALAQRIHDSLVGPARAYLEHCLDYLAETPPAVLEKDEVFEARVRRVPFFLEGTTRLTERSFRAIDVRSRVMKRITANMIDFLIEIVMLGFDIGTDYWKAGKAAGKEAAEEAAQTALKRRLATLEGELSERAARLGAEVDELATQVGKQAEECARVVEQVGSRTRAITREIGDIEALTAEIADLERRAAALSTGAQAVGATIADLEASIAKKSARRRLGRDRVREISNEILRLRESVLPSRRGDIWEICARCEVLREAKGIHEDALRGLRGLAEAADEELDRRLGEIFALNARIEQRHQVRAQINERARALLRDTLRVQDLEAAGLEFRGVAARYAGDPDLAATLTRLETALEQTATEQVTWTLAQEVAIEPIGKGLLENFTGISREERAAYERQLRVSPPTERNDVTSDVGALLWPRGMSSSLWSPTTEVASDSAQLPPGPDDWKLLCYVWRTIGYYGGELVQYTTEGFAKIVEYADYLGLDAFASNLDESTWSGGLAYLKQQFGQARGQLTFSRDTAQRVGVRLDRVRPANLAPGANPRDALRATWSEEDDGDARRHKEAVGAFSVALAKDALDPERFTDDLIPGADVKAPYESLIQVAKRVGGWLKEYESATAVEVADPSFLAQLRAVNARRSASTWTWTDIDHHIDWWAWFVAWAIRLGGVAGLALLPGAGPLVTAAALKAADVVDICAAGLRLVISGMGGLRDANAFVQDFVIINGYFHALWVGPADSGVAGQVLHTAPLGRRE